MSRKDTKWGNSGELDEYDRKILYELDVDGRKTIPKIADSIRKSKDFVAYRLKRLKSKGILVSEFIVLDASKMGLKVHSLYLQVLNPADVSVVIDYFKKQPQTWVINTLMGGKYQIYVSLVVRKIKELEKLLVDLTQRFDEVITAHRVLRVYSSYSLAHNYLFDGDRWVDHSAVCSASKKVELSKREKHLLYLLTIDPRESWFSLAKKMHCRRKKVKEMYEGLVRKEVVLYVRPYLVANKMDYVQKNMIIKLKSQFLYKLEEIKNYLLEQRATKDLMLTVGNYDITGRFVFRNMEEMSAFWQEFLANFGKYINYPYFGNYLEESSYSPGKFLELYWKKAK